MGRFRGALGVSKAVDRYFDESDKSMARSLQAKRLQLDADASADALEERKTENERQDFAALGSPLESLKRGRDLSAQYEGRTDAAGKAGIPLAPGGRRDLKDFEEFKEQRKEKARGRGVGRGPDALSQARLRLSDIQKYMDNNRIKSYDELDDEMRDQAYALKGFVDKSILGKSSEGAAPEKPPKAPEVKEPTLWDRLFNRSESKAETPMSDMKKKKKDTLGVLDNR